MKQPIFKTRETAIAAALDRCLSKGAEPGMAYITRDTYTHCACGQTECVEVVVFLPNQEQIKAYAGICSACGED